MWFFLFLALGVAAFVWASRDNTDFTTGETLDNSETENKTKVL